MQWMFMNFAGHGIEEKDQFLFRGRPAFLCKNKVGGTVEGKQTQQYQPTGKEEYCDLSRLGGPPQGRNVTAGLRLKSRALQQ